MRWSEIDKMNCSVAKSLSILGESWTLMIIRSSFLNCKRFDEFQKELNVTRHLLADRLNKLVENKILVKKPYQTNPVRNEYHLTRKGEALFPIIMSLTHWGDSWMSEQQSPPLKLIHTRCQQRTQPQLVCDQCGDDLNARNTIASTVTYN